MNQDNLKSGDTDELEALFNEIAEQRVWDSNDNPDGQAGADPAQDAAHASAQEPSAEMRLTLEAEQYDDPHDVFKRVGNLTRKLHDALQQLGYDKQVEDAVGSLPDARARLTYIASVTGQAAEKVLACVEKSQKINDSVAEQAKQLDAQWERLLKHELSLDEFKALAMQSRGFIQSMGTHSSTISQHLTDIMLAQDFHDLTGQVVNRIVTVVQTLEQQLVQLLLDTTPPEQRKQVHDGWLAGPTINAEGRTDVCANQTQVDDLLESLGF